jgi:polysaccharide export outer membrane protein
MCGRVRRLKLAGWVAGVGLTVGCQSVPPGQPLFGGGKAVDPEGAPRGTPHIRPAPKAPEVDDSQLPKELNKVTMPPYTVEAPDILLIDANRLVPLPPYKVQPLDSLFVNLPSSTPEASISGIYPVEPDGTINLGTELGGALRVVDMSTQEAQAAVQARLVKIGFKPEAVKNLTVSLAASAGVQRIQGEHLVRPDGTVSLGSYGSVYVAGMTLPQVKAAVEAQLSRYLYKPEVNVDVFAYNSKFYYVITDFAGAGESVVRLPVTGNEAVLDAIANVGGLSSVSSKRVWIARPAPNGSGDQILPVDWLGITRRGNTRTNYQVLPGDRVFVMGNPLSKFDTSLARVLAPVERAFGTTLLGTSTVQQLKFFNQFGAFGGVGGVVR